MIAVFSASSFWGCRQTQIVHPLFLDDLSSGCLLQHSSSALNGSDANAGEQSKESCWILLICTATKKNLKNLSSSAQLPKEIIRWPLSPIKSFMEESFFSGRRSSGCWCDRHPQRRLPAPSMGTGRRSAQAAFFGPVYVYLSRTKP